jgi:hypothetical protein
MTGLVYLYLQNNSFFGNIPATLAYLSKLEHLYLDNNRLYGTIPNALNGLDNLQALWYESAQHAVPLRATPRLGTLNTLVLFITPWRTPLDGLLLPHAEKASAKPLSGRLTRQRSLPHSARRYSANMLTGTIPSSIGRLGARTELWLADSQRSGAIPGARLPQAAPSPARPLAPIWLAA